MKFMNLLAAICATLCIVSAAAPVRAASPEESFQQSFPKIRADDIRPAGIQGLYEVVSGSRILYYAPGPEYIVYGPIVTREGRNLTEERVLKILEQGLKRVPLEKALRIGAGPHQVIEITDPDCPYCRKASAFLSGRNDVTRHVFFFLLASHPNAEAKVRQIFCAENRAKVYEEAMTGKLDDMKFTPCKTAAVDDLLKAHREIGDRVGVTGTPLFLIDGQVVFGADIPGMERILGGKK